MRIADGSIDSLCRLIENNTLNELFMWGCSTQTEEGWSKVFKSLAKNNSISHLDLASISTGDDSALSPACTEILFESIRHHPNLIEFVSTGDY